MNNENISSIDSVIIQKLQKTITDANIAKFPNEIQNALAD